MSKIANINLLMLRAIKKYGSTAHIRDRANYYLNPHENPEVKGMVLDTDGSFMQAVVREDFLTAHKLASGDNRKALERALSECEMYPATERKKHEYGQLDFEEMAEDLREVERTLMNYYRVLDELHREPDHHSENFTPGQKLSQALRLLTEDLSNAIDMTENQAEKAQ